MTYPNSVAVVAGQATEAAQYNNLRADALCLGADPAASGTLRDLLCGAAGQITLQQVGTNGVQLVASDSMPAAVMIDNQIYSVASSLTYSMSADNFPAAGYYSIYVVALASGAFSLGVGTSIPAHGRKIGGLIWSGTFIVRGSIRNELTEAIFAGKNPFVCNGRLSLASGTPVPDDDIYNAEDLYFSPYLGNEVSLFLGGQWVVFSFTEISMSLSGLQREIPYDVFLTVASAGLQLVSQMWGSASVRSVALVRQDGILVSSADRSLRYLGTVCVNAAGFGEDSKAGRLVWNAYNRISRSVLALIATSKTQGTAHMNNWAPYYDEDAPVVRLLVPSVECDFDLEGVGMGFPISESDRGYGRGAALGILKDPMTVSPYTGNASCVPVFTHTNGAGPITVGMHNFGADVIGYHRYYLGFWSNYSFYPIGTSMTASGEKPGLQGVIWS